jgi:hypothetical protein
MITFQTLTPEEKFNRALAEIYTILLKLADEKQNERRASVVDSKECDCTLTTEYPPEV